MTSKKVVAFSDVRFETSFHRLYRPLCFFAYRILEDQSAAEDVVQTAFLKLLNDKPDLENESHLKHFLYKSVRNACLNQIRRENLHTEILDSLKPEEPEDNDEPDFLQSVVRAEVYQQIMQAVDELPTECSKVFKLAYLANLNNEEIAEKLSISINTVKSQKNKAKKRLQERLKHLYPIVLILFNL
jgi:RNA polymerase sigma-70 factor (family 1)